MSKGLYLHGSSLFPAKEGLCVSPCFQKNLPLCCPAVIKDVSLQARNKIAPFFSILTRINRSRSSFGKTGSSLKAT